MEAPAYLYGNAREQALTRLQALEAIEDPDTIAVLESIGINAGPRCLEIGAGAGSIARWLAARVGPGRTLM